MTMHSPHAGLSGTAAGHAGPADWDPMEPSAVADPLGAYADLRERCPVARSDRWGGFWALLRHEDIVAAALDTETFISSKKATIPDSTGPGRPPRPPLESDRPQHTQYRRLLAPYFSAGRVNESDARIRAIAAELIETAVARGECDLVPIVALPMPALVLCVFLGLPTDDWSKLKSWSMAVIDAARSGDPAGHADANDALYAYVTAVVEDRRKAPREASTDLITGLLELRVDGRRLDDNEVAGIIRLLLQAGHNTTTNGIGSAFRYLAVHVDEQARLRNDPSLVPTAVDEILRAFSPAQLLARTVEREVEIRGCPLHVGDKVGLFWASANRDPAAFDDPDRIDLTRTPNRHVAFGYGIHRCIGAHLARLEMCIAVEEILARTSRFELIGDAPEAGWPNIGPRAVPVRIHRG
jgi:cytochrome P450